MIFIIYIWHCIQMKFIWKYKNLFRLNWKIQVFIRRLLLYAKLAKVHCSSQGYWNGLSATEKIAKVPEETTKQWLIKQALWQICIPVPRYTPRRKFNVSVPNAVHQAHCFFLPHDKLPRGRTVYKYVLPVFTQPRQPLQRSWALTSKDSAEVAKVLQSTYKPSPLTWTLLL